MVIIQIEGGLGNQMFQYALYISFINKGTKAKLDISKFNENFSHNGYELERVFNLNAKYSSKKERAIVKGLSKILFVVNKHPYKEKKEWQWMYHPEANKISFGFLKGYWQSGKYFSSVSDKIKEKFIFPVLKDEKNKTILEKIKNTNAVSLHIRRGDYLTEGISCTIDIDYYFAAIKIINEQVSAPEYFIFSDDIKWCKENIKEKNITFIDWNKGQNSFIDMQLMSECKHNVIANSSFSWWGAWLNSNPDKIVIAPKKWMPALVTSKDIIPANWIQLPVKF